MLTHGRATGRWAARRAAASVARRHAIPARPQRATGRRLARRPGRQHAALGREALRAVQMRRLRQYALRPGDELVSGSCLTIDY